MTPANFKEILIAASDTLLKEMTGKSGVPQPPTTWDINNGWCEEFVQAVLDIVPDAEEAVDDGENEVGHSFILRRGKYYDAECVEGVDDYHDLPIFKNQGKSRAEVLEERHSWQPNSKR